METRPTEHRTQGATQAADHNTTIVPVNGQRHIAVGDARTIVVRPRVPAPYKAMIVFSFVLNALLLIALLVGGLAALNIYNKAQAQLAAVEDLLNLDTSVGQRIETVSNDPSVLFDSDPAPAVNLLNRTLGDVMTSIEGLQSAHIRTSIPIDHQQPVNFSVPVNQQTVVQITEPVPLVAPATFTLPGGGGQINGSVALSLPAGMQLPVNLSMTIPISETLPVQLDVPVDISMQDTELADDFQRLHDLIEPAAETVRAR